MTIVHPSNGTATNIGGHPVRGIGFAPGPRNLSKNIEDTAGCDDDP